MFLYECPRHVAYFQMRLARTLLGFAEGDLAGGRRAEAGASVQRKTPRVVVHPLEPFAGIGQISKGTTSGPSPACTVHATAGKLSVTRPPAGGTDGYVKRHACRFLQDEYGL